MTIRALRLLPCVVLLGTTLLALKGTGLMHEAHAQTATGMQARTASLAPPAPPPTRDYADDQSTAASAAEEDVLTSLAKRRSALDARDADLAMQSNMLAATEARVDDKISQLKQLQAQIAALLGQRDQAQKDQIAALVKTYSGMKPASAAAIFDNLPDGVLIPVAQAMKPDDLGNILAKMSPDSAQKLTVKLADRLALPETTPAAPQAAAAAAPDPAPAAKGS